MVAKETEILFHKLLYNMLEDIISIDMMREVLLQQNDFNAHIIFQVIDNTNKNFIDEIDIASFLK
jgi:hypothetical protein